jgi:hypothetical protein
MENVLIFERVERSEKNIHPGTLKTLEDESTTFFLKVVNQLVR